MESRRRVQMVLARDTPIQNPRVIVGIPEAGLVGLIATSHIIQRLKLDEIGHVDSELMPQVVVIHGSEPKSPLRIFGGEKERLLVILSEIPLLPRFSYEFAIELENWAKSQKAEMVVGVTGLPSRNRMESEKEERPNVFGVSTAPGVAELAKRSGVRPLDEGMIVGTHATLLQRGAGVGVPNLTLLAECYPEFPDPSAAASSVEVLNSMLSIRVDTKPLLDESEEIRLRMRDLMRRTRQTMQPAPEAPSVYA